MGCLAQSPNPFPGPRLSIGDIVEFNFRVARGVGLAAVCLAIWGAPVALVRDPCQPFVLASGHHYCHMGITLLNGTSLAPLHGLSLCPVPRLFPSFPPPIIRSDPDRVSDYDLEITIVEARDLKDVARCGVLVGVHGVIVCPLCAPAAAIIPTLHSLSAEPQTCVH